MKRFLITLLPLLLLLAACGQETITEGDGSARNSLVLTDSRPVRLLQATAYTSSHYGIPADNFELRVLVKDLAYAKEVDLWIKTESGVWTNDRAGIFVEKSGNGCEVWNISATRAVYPYSYGYELPKLAKPYQFAIRYKVNGRTYWDNNNGANYTLGYKDGELLGQGVNVLALYDGAYRNSYAGTGAFYGQVLVRNLAYDKNVEIVYTTDGWATTKTASCHFVPNNWFPYGTTVSYPNIQGVERWSFSVDVPLDTTSIEYAVSYRVNGVNYWDNNSGMNYVISLQ